MVRSVNPSPTAPNRSPAPAMTRRDRRAQLRSRITQNPETTRNPAQTRKKAKVRYRMERTAEVGASPYSEKSEREMMRNDPAIERAENPPPITATIPAATTEAGARSRVMRKLIAVSARSGKESGWSKVLDISL